ESPAVASEVTLFAFNADPGQVDRLSLPGALTGAGGRFARLHDATPMAASEAIDVEISLPLEPLEARILAAPAASSGAIAGPPAPAASLARLEALAARRVAIEKVSPELDGGR